MWFELYEYTTQSIIVYILLSYVIEPRSYLNPMLMAELFYFLVLILYILNGDAPSNYSSELLALTILIVSACESVIGLTFLITFKKKSLNSLYITENNKLRG